MYLLFVVWLGAGSRLTLHTLTAAFDDRVACDNAVLWLTQQSSHPGQIKPRCLPKAPQHADMNIALPVEAR